MRDQKHEIVCALIDWIDEHGRVPTRDEFVKTTDFSTRRIYQNFSCWEDVKKAVGRTGDTPKNEKESIKKRVKDFYHRDLKDHLSKPTNDTLSYNLPCYTETLLIGDLHCPWWDEAAVKTTLDLIEELKPRRIIQMGDAYDFYAFSKYPRSHITFSPEDEVKIARDQLEYLFSEAHIRSPRAELYMLRGNHDVRPHKRVLESSCPELETFFNIDNFWLFDAVNTVLSTRDVLTLDGIAYHHGHLSGIGKHINSLGNNAHGHTHRGGLTWKKVNGIWHFELDVGYLGDENAKCMSYTPLKGQHWSKGLGYISQYGPHWLPF